MKHLVYLLIFSLVLLSCEESSEETPNPQLAVEDSTLYGNSSYTFPKLSKNALEIVQAWSIYPDFELEATTLKQVNLEELKVKMTKLLSYTDSLSKKIPDTLSSSSINARLTIVNTRVNLLHQVVNRDRIDAEKVNIHIDECNKAVKNFLVQINEKFEKDGIDNQKIDNEKKELEKRKKYFDSIQKAELEDQQK